MFAVTATIAVGTFPAGVAVSPDGVHAYVANEDANTVSVIDTATNTVTTIIPAGPFLIGALAVSPDGTRLYATHGPGTVSVIDINPSSPAYNTVTATIPTGDEPLAVAVTPDGTRLYVANWKDSTVSVINTAAKTVTKTIPVSWPGGVALSPAGTYAYVTNPVVATVSVIDTNSSSPTYNTVTDTISVGNGAEGMAVSPDGALVYVANSLDFTVSVINTATKTVTTTIPVGANPSEVAVSPDGSTIYVANSFDNTVTVISNGPPRWHGKLPKLVGELIGGVAAGGGGWLVIGDLFYKIPPRPMAIANIARAAAPHLRSPIENRELAEQLRTTLPEEK